MSSHLSHINISDGGVPKTSIPTVRVTAAGLQGDRQKDLRYHGGPDRAVCLWSFELIEVLKQEGHPIEPGSTGENLTISGLDWAELQLGSQVTIGDQLQLEITEFAAPCGTIAKYFTGRKYGRISEKKYPGTSRLYARVLNPGVVTVGDRITISNQS
jgi:MOSC domain-containing protein YiiM